jgi:hypothetical protein
MLFSSSRLSFITLTFLHSFVRHALACAQTYLHFVSFRRVRLTRLYFELELPCRTCVNVHDMYFTSYPHSYIVYQISISIIVTVAMAVKQTLCMTGVCKI